MTGTLQPLHYASPRLIKDAPDEASGLATDFVDTVNAIQASRRLNAMNAAKNLQKVQRENERLEAESSELRARLEQAEKNEEKYHLYLEEKFGFQLTD